MSRRELNADWSNGFWFPLLQQLVVGSNPEMNEHFFSRRPWILVAKVWVKEMVLRPWIVLERVWATDNRPGEKVTGLRVSASMIPVTDTVYQRPCFR